MVTDLPPIDDRAAGAPVNATEGLLPQEAAAIAELKTALAAAIRSPAPAAAAMAAHQVALSRAPNQAARINALLNQFFKDNPRLAATASVGSAGPGGSARTSTSSSGGGGNNKKEFVVVPVLYGTDRAPIKGLSLPQWREQVRAKGSKVAYYGDEHDLSRGINCGWCFVSVPVRVHEEGNVERPPMFEKESLASDFTLRGLIPLEGVEMKARILELARRSKEKNDAFVFIHGYNVAFNDAVMRTAQIAYDFGFAGAPILFSWPSSGGYSDYMRDGESVHLAVDSLYRFLDEIVLKSGAKKVHLIAHSMGNRLLVRALKKFSEQGRSGLFGEIVLAAPDVPQIEFSIAGPERIAALGERVTLYASSKDKALMSSAKFNKRSRLGESGEKLFLAPGIDSIDASEVDTDMLHHSYFANAGPVVLDLARLLVAGVGPNASPRNLRSEPRDGSLFWRVGK